MRNKTPWFLQNFLEGLEEEALPKVSRKAMPRVSHKQQERSRCKASLADERLPDPQPLLDSDDSLETFRKNSATDENGRHGPSPLAQKQQDDYIVVDSPEPEQCLQKHFPPVAVSVPKWKVEEQEALNPRWTDLSDSFKDFGVQ
jgi:hypothetical protein